MGSWSSGEDMSDSAIVQVRRFLEQLQEGSWSNEDARKEQAGEVLKLLTEWGRCWPKPEREQQ